MLNLVEDVLDNHALESISPEETATSISLVEIPGESLLNVFYISPKIGQPPAVIINLTLHYLHLIPIILLEPLVEKTSSKV
jgi:hypothetical protein